MKERLSAALEKAPYRGSGQCASSETDDIDPYGPITTIDGFCSYIIRNYFHMIGLDPGYRTAEEGD